MQFVDDNRRLTSGKLWSAIGAISGKKVQPKNNAIFFHEKAITVPKKIANKLNWFMANNCKLQKTHS